MTTGGKQANNVRINYCLTGSGWAECRITIGNKTVVTTASYLSDALGEFARAVVALLDGATSSRFSFAEEPGLFEWKLQRKPNGLRCVVKWHPDWHINDETMRDDPHAKTRIDEIAPLEDFIHEFFAMLDSVLNRYGIDGYRKEWVQHDFPLAHYERIKEYVTAMDR